MVMILIIWHNYCNFFFYVKKVKKVLYEDSLATYNYKLIFFGGGMVRRKLILLNLLIVLMFGAGNVAAATFNNAYLFSDNSSSGWVLNSFVDFNSNPGALPTTTVSNVGSSVLDYLAPDDGYWGFVLNNVAAANGERVTWVADNKILTAGIPDLSLAQMSLSTNLMQNGGTALNPIIAWNNDDYDDSTDHFRIRVHDKSNYEGFTVDERYTPGAGNTFSFDFSSISFEFAQGIDYLVRIELRGSSIDLVDPTVLNLDDFSQATFSGDAHIINRSKAYMDYSNTPSVPVPGTLLLLGSGILGLVGFRRKQN